jgi:hypothetical protein
VQYVASRYVDCATPTQDFRLLKTSLNKQKINSFCALDVSFRSEVIYLVKGNHKDQHYVCLYVDIDLKAVGDIPIYVL